MPQSITHTSNPTMGFGLATMQLVQLASKSMEEADIQWLSLQTAFHWPSLQPDK